MRFAWALEAAGPGSSRAVVCEWVSCGWSRCLRCGGALYAHGPYWWEYPAQGARVPLSSSAPVVEDLEPFARAELSMWAVTFGVARDAQRWQLFASAGAPRRREPPEPPRPPPPPPPAPPSVPPIHEDLARLGLSPRYTREELGRAYKRAASKAHPDKGGRTEDLRDLNLARDRLLEQLDGPATWKPRDD